MRTMNDDISWTELQELAKKIHNAEAAVIERAVEESLQGGKHGVLVVRDTWQKLISAKVNTLVPYGTIYVYTNMGYEDPRPLMNWIDHNER